MTLQMPDDPEAPDLKTLPEVYDDIIQERLAKIRADGYDAELWPEVWVQQDRPEILTVEKPLDPDRQQVLRHRFEIDYRRALSQWPHTGVVQMLEIASSETDPQRKLAALSAAHIINQQERDSR